jgi:phosphoribosyl 1,2-cyclic phosphodiesterase
VKIKIWGCRGSIAAPGPTTLRYGGNSTCVEIRTKTGQIIIIDAGSGIRNLGKALSQEKDNTQLRFFITHSHWDHLLGFPFFRPAYLDNFTLTFCSGPHAQDSIKNYLTHQMAAPFFPVDFNLLKAKFDFQCQRPHMEPGHCRLDGFEVLPIPLNHPNGGYGYKFMEKGKSFVFLTDNEMGFPHEGGLSRAEYIEFCRGADLLFHDAQFTEEEYKTTRGWGHSTFGDAVDLGVEAGVKSLGFFHHDPDRTDEELSYQLEICREQVQRKSPGINCFAATEGMEIEL